ncbi:glycoside hydrolase family 15 protein [Halonotius roseus]|uniref:Glycoside hydrolase family 15 n=1 Tax=Halonotius roseus TaxID=2511997 RepID=A0A544QS37_9EURY|nr:glycoside hydrolase family 15 protein [Halonotius roseus]TQQ82257.1 glycoside hydrolase family 15 [Halonotius roseus]
MSAPFGGGRNVLAAVNKYPGTNHRAWNGALIEEISAFRLDVEQLYDLHVLLRRSDSGATLDVRNDAVASTVGYSSSRVPEIEIHNSFRFPDGEAATLDQRVLVSPNTPALLIDNHVRFADERGHSLFTLASLGMDDVRSGDDIEEATYRHTAGYDFIVAHDGNRYLALAQRNPETGQTTFDGQRIGVQGVASGPDRSAWQDLYLDGAGGLTETTHKEGKVDTAIGLHAGRDTDVRWTTGIGFGTSEQEAVDNARWPLYAGYERERATFVAFWKAWCENISLSSPDDATARKLYELSVMSMKCAQDRRGGIIAGAFKPEQSSYRHIWPRDLVIMVQALSAVDATPEARRALDWLNHAQITSHTTDERGIDRYGTWWQNYYTDGSDHWQDLQLDQVGGPIYAHWLLYEETGDDALLEAHYHMSRRAADFLLSWEENGFPKAHQDPWEEIWGHSTEGSAAAIAGLRSMAELASAAGDDAYADRCRERANTWTSNFKEYCFEENGLLGSHYVTASNPEYADSPPPDQRPDGAAFMAYWPWNVVAADDETMLSTVKHADNTAWRAKRSPCLGRYPGDDYTPTGVDEDGGWPICEAYADMVRWQSGHDTDAVSDFVYHHAPEWVTSANLLPERVDGAGRPRWNANLLWSQATYVLLAESMRRGEPYGMAPGE